MYCNRNIIISKLKRPFISATCMHSAALPSADNLPRLKLNSALSMPAPGICHFLLMPFRDLRNVFAIKRNTNDEPFCANFFEELLSCQDYTKLASKIRRNQTIHSRHQLNRLKDGQGKSRRTCKNSSSLIKTDISSHMEKFHIFSLCI